MSKPFRFAPLLDLVSQREDEQTQVLAALSAEEYAAREQLRALVDEQERAFSQCVIGSGVVDADQYRAAVAYAERLGEQIEEQRAVLAEVSERVALARDGLLEIVKERRSFEHLRDQDETAAALVEDRREASAVDDLNMSRHIRRGA